MAVCVKRNLLSCLDAPRLLTSASFCSWHRTPTFFPHCTPPVLLGLIFFPAIEDFTALEDGMDQQRLRGLCGQKRLNTEFTETLRALSVEIFEAGRPQRTQFGCGPGPR